MKLIDFQAREWQRKMIGCWKGHACPRLYPERDALVACLALENGLPGGPLRSGRLDLVRAATRREEPSRDAFVTLALFEYVEDLMVGVSALLPYQLAWCRAGVTLGGEFGLPGGVASVGWPGDRW